MKGIIVSGGEIDLSLLDSCIKENRGAVIISVDAAILCLEKLQIIPQIMVGDFDTLSDEEIIKKYEKRGVGLVRHNPVKDFSDSELAIDWAYNEGIKEVIMLGALGKRFDHGLSNILMLLKYKKLGMNITIYDKYNKIYVKSSSFTLEKTALYGKYISFFAIGKNVLINSITGVAYPVKNKEVDNVKSPSLFISNEITGDFMSAVFQGDLLVVESRD